MKNVFAFLVLMAVIVLTVGDGLMLSQNGNVLGLIALILLVVTIYFFPALVAWHRFHKHVMAIFVVQAAIGGARERGDGQQVPPAEQCD
jgi:hypothetical protein